MYIYGFDKMWKSTEIEMNWRIWGERCYWKIISLKQCQWKVSCRANGNKSCTLVVYDCLFSLFSALLQNLYTYWEIAFRSEIIRNLHDCVSRLLTDFSRFNVRLFESNWLNSWRWNDALAEFVKKVNILGVIMFYSNLSVLFSNILYNKNVYT